MTVATDPRKTGITGGMTLLAASAVAVNLTGTTTETTLATVTVPGGAMGLNGGLLIYATWSITNSANNKTARIRLGGLAGTQYAGIVATASATIAHMTRLRNRNSQSSQVSGGNASGVFGSSVGAVVTSSLDMSVAQDIAITAQLALGTETITLENYEVWLLP